MTGVNSSERKGIVLGYTYCSYHCALEINFKMVYLEVLILHCEKKLISGGAKLEIMFS